MQPKREITVRKTTLSEQGEETDLLSLSPGERMGLIEQITIDMWAMMGQDIAQQRLQRHVVSVRRRGS